jgi:hypothetical protein
MYLMGPNGRTRQPAFTFRSLQSHLRQRFQVGRCQQEDMPCVKIPPTEDSIMDFGSRLTHLTVLCHPR